MLEQLCPIRVLVILVIDDDAMSRELLCVLLKGEGFVVYGADSGDAALAQLSQDSIPPDLVLVDLQMPGTSGTQLAQELRHRCDPATLLLAMSGSQPADAALTPYDGFLLKPFKMTDVAVAFETVSLSLNKVPLADQNSLGRATRDRLKNVPGRASASQEASNVNMNVAHQIHRGTVDVVSAEVSDSSAILNETIYRQLAESIPGKQLQEMYTLCVNDARERIAGMRSYAANDGARFVREAHSIKGGAGMLGATELHRMASDLESRGLDADTTEDEDKVNSLDELSAACDRLERMLGSRV